MNIHVGNLPLELTDRELRAAFEACGTVESVEIITNRRTGEPLGYGFVVMASEEEGMKAIATLNGTTLQGKEIAVTKANRPQGRRRSFRDKPRPPR
jgi:RNA recognition motif-containing protein